MARPSQFGGSTCAFAESAAPHRAGHPQGLVVAAGGLVGHLESAKMEGSTWTVQGPIPNTPWDWLPPRVGARVGLLYFCICQSHGVFGECFVIATKLAELHTRCALIFLQNKKGSPSEVGTLCSDDLCVDILANGSLEVVQALVNYSRWRCSRQLRQSESGR